MKKISGKVVSLVLALALVVTSFSTAAFAATKNQSASIAPKTATVYVSNGGKTATVDLISYFKPDNMKDFNLTSGEPVSDPGITGIVLKDVVMTAGNNVASLKTNSTEGVVDHVNLTLADKDKSRGTVTLMARYVATTASSDANGNTITYNMTASLTVKVLGKGTAVVGDSAWKIVAGGYPDAVAALTKDSGSAAKGSVFVVGPAADDNILASYAKANIVTEFDKTKMDFISDENATNYVLTASGNGSVSIAKSTAPATTEFTLTVKPVTGAGAQAPYGALGSFNVRANKIVADGDKAQKSSAAADDVTTGTTKVENKVKITDAKLNTIFTYKGATYISDKSYDEKTDTTLPINNTQADGKGTYVQKCLLVTNTDIDASIIAGGKLTVTGGNVGVISAEKTDTEKGLTGSTIEVSNGVVGGIKNAKTVTIAKGTVGNVSDVAGDVAVNGGKVGDISAAGEVKINTNDVKLPITVGKVSGAKVTVGDATTAAGITVGEVKSPALNVASAKAKVAGWNVNFASGTLTYSNDYAGAGLNATNVSTLGTTTVSITIDQGATVSYASGVALPDMNVNGTLKLEGTTKANVISGSGTVEFVPGALTITGSLSGVSMKASKDFKVGDTLFTATAYQVYEGSFTPVGYTVEKIAGDKTDTFKVKSLEFYGLMFNKTSDSLVVKSSATYTVSAYPAGTKIPDGYKVKFSFDGGDDYFKTTANENGSLTIEALKYESIFGSLNKATATATLYDEYDIAAYQYKDAKLNVEIVEKPAYTIDTQNLQLKQGNTYQYKITTSDGVEPNVVLGTSGVATLVKSGADSANKAFFFKVTPVAGVAAGTKVGLYVNGVKADVITVVAGDTYKLDTKTVAVAKGATYQVKATAATAPTVVAGSSSFTVSAVTKVGNDYFFKISPSANAKTGDVCGFYVNGEKTPAMTATVK